MAGKPLDHTKVYNSHRLWEHGQWSKNATKLGPNGCLYQDHYFTANDGSVWRPRREPDYYNKPSGKLMLVCVTPPTDTAVQIIL